MDVKIEPSWKAALQEEFTKDYFKRLTDFVRNEYTFGKVFPPPKQLFHAFEKTPLENVKVVILGQDPYHGIGQAHGLCFSVQEGVRTPPSLVNIYKEIAEDVGANIPSSGNLDRWAEQGVFLLNAILTVRAHQAASHRDKGWEEFTDAAIKKISQKNEHVVFLLWGSFAGKKSSLIDATKHLILKAPHPSPLSAHRGFFGCKHFSQANDYLEKHGKQPIAW